MLAVAPANVLAVWATVLPDACGADSVRFKVSSQKGSRHRVVLALIRPIVIVENPELDPKCAGPTCHCNCSHWHGWNMGGSQPRQVVLCFFGSPWGASFVCELAVGFGSLNKLVGMSSFTVEPGKVYYYEVKPVIRPMGEHEQDEYKLELTSLGEDEGKYWVKVSALSTSIPKR
jgi:hypothetical protein